MVVKIAWRDWRLVRILSNEQGGFPRKAVMLLSHTPGLLGGGLASTAGNFFFSISSGGWEKIKLKLTALPCIFIYVVFRFNPIAFAIQREPACPSVPTIAIA